MANKNSKRIRVLHRKEQRAANKSNRSPRFERQAVTLANREKPVRESRNIGVMPPHLRTLKDKK